MVAVSGGERSEARLKSALRLEDLGVRVAPVLNNSAVAVESANGSLARPRNQRGRSLASQATKPFPFLPISRTRSARRSNIPYSLVTATDLGQVLAVAGGVARRHVGDASAGRIGCGGR